MTDDPRLAPLTASLPPTVPFVGPETQERARGRPFRARIGANENVFGPSPRAIAAMAGAAGDIWKYGDPENHDLKQALSASHGVPVANIVVGEGIDGLLGYLVRMMIGAGDAVVTSDGAYPTFNYHVAGFGGVLHKVPFRDDREDPPAVLARARETGARLIYLSNPDNPMGTWHDAGTIAAMIAGVPDGALLVLDEAYVEFAPDGVAPPMSPDEARVIRFRTFSKAYGMAGARVGYGIGPAPLIAAFDRIRNHFGMNRAAQAGALAALADGDWLDQTRANVAAARARIAAIAANNGLACLPSGTNFVAVDCGQGGEFARALLAELTAADIFVRMPFHAPGDRCIRIGCGTMAEMDVLAAALPGALARARAR